MAPGDSWSRASALSLELCAPSQRAAVRAWVGWRPGPLLLLRLKGLWDLPPRLSSPVLCPSPTGSLVSTHSVSGIFSKHTWGLGLHTCGSFRMGCSSRRACRPLLRRPSRGGLPARVTEISVSPACTPCRKHPSPFGPTEAFLAVQHRCPCAHAPCLVPVPSNRMQS